MRVPPLVGLIGLIGSVVASPTPSDPKASAPKRLVVYAEDNFRGPSLEIEATNRCVKLEAPVFKNLYSYGVVDQVCYFMDSEKCNTKKLITVDAQGSAVWGRVDVDGTNGYGRRIAAVYCSDKVTKGISDNTTTAEVDSTFIESRATNVVASPPGYVQACKYNKKQSTMMVCTTVDALNSCKGFDSSIAKQIDVITQGRKSDCTYWENSDCRGRYVVESFNQGDGDYNPNLGPGNKDGKLISAVSCKNFGSSGVLEANHIRTVHTDQSLFDKRQLPNFSVEPSSVRFVRSSPQLGDSKESTLHTADDKPGSIVVCSEFRFQGSCGIHNAMNLCLALPQQVWRNVKSLTAAKGAHCEFYGDDHGCNDVRVRYDLVDHGVSDEYVYDDVGYTHVWCTALSSAKLDQSAGIAPPTEKRETDEPKSALDAPAPHEGQVLVADVNDLGGKTQLIDTTTDDNNCAPLFNQFFWNLHSLLQYKGSVCTYWQYNCGSLSDEDKQVFTIDSRNGDYRLNSLPDEFGDNRHKIAYIQCINAVLADEHMAQLDPADPTSFRSSLGSEVPPRSADNGTLADTVKTFWSPDRDNALLWVCHDPNMAGQCFAYTGECAPNPFNVDAIESLWLAKGYRCAMYAAWECEATRGPPHYVDARDDELVINDIKYEIWSMRCAPSPYRGEKESEAGPESAIVARSLDNTPMGLASHRGY
jgi:hypothetical protein